MKKIVLSVLVIAASLSVASAQTVVVGVKGGVNIPNLTSGGTNTPLSEGYKSYAAWGAGAFAEIKFSELFSLQTGLEYSQQGGQKDGIQAMPGAPIYQGMKAGLIGQMGEAQGNAMYNMAAPYLPDKYVYADMGSKAKFNYLMLPVQAKFSWKLGAESPFRVYVNAGLFGSYLMSADRVSTGSSAFFADKNGTTLSAYATSKGAPAQILPIFMGFDSQKNDLNNTQDITSDVHSFNFGFIGGVGFSCRVAPRHQVFIEGGGNYGFMKIQKSSEYGQNRIGTASVMVGYGFTL